MDIQVTFGQQKYSGPRRRHRQNHRQWKVIRATVKLIQVLFGFSYVDYAGATSMPIGKSGPIAGGKLGSLTFPYIFSGLEPFDKP